MDPSSFDPLSQLRDVHLPDAVSWWPPAPGWWIVALAVLCAVALLVRWILRKLRSPLRAARLELDRIEHGLHSDGDCRSAVIALSALLRRVSMVVFPDEQVAGLSGTRWLEFLDRTGSTRAFTEGPGSELIRAPYQASTITPAAEILTVARQWLTHQKSAGALR